MKVLGVIFDQNQNWSQHVTKNINDCQRILHSLKVIRKFFSQEKFFNIMTSFSFSTVRAYRVRNFGSRVPDWVDICSKHDYLK